MEISEKFSLSAVLWRSGWSPTGLLSFRTKPLPLTLVSLIENNGDSLLQVPGEASVRCGGLCLDGFESAHASLAPSSVVQSQCVLKSVSCAVHDEEIITAPTRAQIRVERDSFQANLEQDRASSGGGGGSNHSSSAPVSPKLRRLNSNEAMLELMVSPSNSNSSAGPDGGGSSGGGGDTNSGAGWFGASTPTVDDARVLIKTKLWEEADQQNQRQKRGRSLGSFVVSRTWRQWRRATTLIRDLHPEVVMPPLELLGDVNGNSNANANCVFTPHQRLECFMEFIRIGVASIQRCSAVTAKCPVVVTLLFEQDPEAFETFLSEAEAQHRMQTDGRAASARHMIPTMPEFDAVHVQRCPPAGIVLARDAREQRALQKESAPGFFSKIFGSGGSASSQAPEVVVPLSPAEVSQARSRCQAADELFQDIRKEMATWETWMQMHAILDTTAHNLWAEMQDLGDELRNWVDGLAEEAEVIVSKKCPFPELDAPDVSSSSPVAAAAAAAQNIHADENEEGFSMQRESSAFIAECEAKSALRYAMMMATARTDAMQGAQAMLAGIASATRTSRLIAQTAVMYLRAHSNIIGNIKLYASQPVGEQLLDFITHRLRPVSISELEWLREDLLNRMHTASVLVFSLSRQLCDSVLQAEAALRASALEDAIAVTSATLGQQPLDASIQHSSPAGGGAARGNNAAAFKKNSDKEAPVVEDVEKLEQQRQQQTGEEKS